MRRRREGGFTLIELVFTVAIMGIITVPLANFMLSYLDNYQTTSNRIADSHDIQIATAYFSQDSANTGVHVNPAPLCVGAPSTCYPLQRSAWQGGSANLPASYCGQGAGSLVLLLEWDTWNNPSAATGYSGTPGPIYSVAYVTEGSTAPRTLHRIYCRSTQNGQASATATSDTTIVHNLQSAAAKCSDSSGTTVTCDNSTPPVAFSISLTISATSGAHVDKAAPTNQVVLTGQRRQT